MKGRVSIGAVEVKKDKEILFHPFISITEADGKKATFFCDMVFPSVETANNFIDYFWSVLMGPKHNLNAPGVN